jgi:hypothetical protein
MKSKYLKVVSFSLCLSLWACVDRIDFAVPEPGLLTIIEGRITDQPGGYTVRISKGLRLDVDSTIQSRITGAIVTLYDDEGNQESFNDMGSGIYHTSGIIQGQVNRSYHIVAEMPNGEVFQSEPDKLTPVGEIQEIRYEYEARKVEMPWGVSDANVFNIYVDASSQGSETAFTRWRFTGTYKTVTYPELHLTWNPPYTPYMNPPPCSGYKVIGGPIGSGGLLEKFGDCTCCECWVNEFESQPQLSDNLLVEGNQFSNIKVGEVRISSVAFQDKYLVEVEQSSLTRSAFEFLKLVRNQKENASSIFQPPSGELRGNIKPVNNQSPVVGIFWATSLKTKHLFLTKNDVPYPLPEVPIGTILDACYYLYPNATNVKHPLWD